MKRILLTLVTLAVLGCLINMASADYLVVKIDINNLNLKTEKGGQSGAVGAMGNFGGGGKTGMPGGAGGIPGGMMANKGMSGSMGMMGMMGGGMSGGMPGGMKGGGGTKGGGMKGGPGGAMGMPGGAGMMGMMGMPGGGMKGMPGGMQGMPGGMMGQGMNAFGAKGATGAFGALGGAAGQFGATGKGEMGNSGAMGNAGAGNAGAMGNVGVPPEPAPKNTKNTPIWVSAIVALHNVPQGRGAAAEIANQWTTPGKHAYVPLYNDSFQYQYIRKELPSREFDKKFKKQIKDGVKDPTAYLNLAAWAWSHGLGADYKRAMDQLKTVAPNHPAVGKYDAVNEILRTPLSKADPALKSLVDDFTKTKKYRMVLSEQGHYGVLTKLGSTASVDPGVKRRLQVMEDNLESFFYWFTLQENVPLPSLPNKKLLSILVQEPQDFHKEHADWGNVPMLGNGFTPRRDNVMVLSAKRLDDLFQVLETTNVSLANQLKVTRDELINGKVWDRPESRTNAVALAITQTMYMVQKSLEEEAEHATISHEGTLQLLAATGLLPRNVAVPGWLQAGLASYFETPYGAPYPSSGLASWSNLISFKLERPALGKAPDVLHNVISDHYFRQAKKATAEWEKNKDNDKLFQKAHEDWQVARSTSWALTYFLIQNKKFPQLLNFSKEIADMPRDLELDPRALEACFARAFNMEDAKDPRRVDSGRFGSLAENWFREMESVNLEIPEFEREAMQNLLRIELQPIPKKNPPPPPPPPPG